MHVTLYGKYTQLRGLTGNLTGNLKVSGYRERSYYRKCSYEGRDEEEALH
jgi:hypothetical protein